LDVLPHEKKIVEYEETIRKLRNGEDGVFDAEEVADFEEKLHDLKKNVYSSLTPWERVIISRHPKRPHASDYIENLCDDFIELCGDRTFGDDAAVIGGLAVIGGKKCVVMGQEKGKDTESRVHHNFGMVNPEGFRKAIRLARLAEKFGLPIVSFIDTPGAYPGLEAEERGQGWAIAENLRDFSLIRTPIVVVIIGEGCSGGALGMGVGDVIGMLQHAYYSVISPEGCASILWKDADKKSIAAATLKLNAEDLHDKGLIDEIIEEPLGGAHHSPRKVYDKVKKFITKQWEELQTLDIEELVERRYRKFRIMGEYSEEI
jgi:acetyl-CoA carboxylase carboxyl transferase subunit alpha